MIIGLCGFGKSGKDSAFSGLERSPKTGLKWSRVAFADPIKSDLAPLIAVLKERYPGFDPISPEGKEILRDLYETWGTRICRKLNDNTWISLAESKIEEIVKSSIPGTYGIAITDVRNINELEFVYGLGGYVAYVSRPGHGPAAPIEAETIPECLRHKPSLLAEDFILNDGTLNDLQEKIVKWTLSKMP